MKRFTPASRLFVTTVLALAVPQIVSPQARANGFQSNDLLKLRSVTAVQLSPDATRAPTSSITTTATGPAVRPALGDDARRRQVACGSAAKGTVERSRSGRPTASGSRIAAVSATRADLSSRGRTEPRARFARGDDRHQRAAARQRHRPSPGRPTASGSRSSRRARPGNRATQRRSDGDHAVSLQARRGRRA